MVPDWLHYISIFSLMIGGLSAILIILDEWRDPQHMWIMNVVWPATALFAGVLSVMGYFFYGKLSARSRVKSAMEQGEPMPNKAKTPFAGMVAKGAAHCGSGCTLGDIIAEWLAFFVPTFAIWLGWQSIFSEKIFAVWILDFIIAFTFGVAFQYFTIKPMRELSVRQGIVQAVKADILSLTAWQIGMYSFMAVAHFWIFKQLLGVKLEVPSAEFWFMMQIAMLFGFSTSYPVNWLLISKGVKEKM